MKVQLYGWSVRGPENLFLYENPGPKYIVVLVRFPERAFLAENFRDSLGTVLETGKISFHNDRSKKFKLSEEQMKWLKMVSVLECRVIKVTV
jgi:hypothetical protein